MYTFILNTCVVDTYIYGQSPKILLLMFISSHSHNKKKKKTNFELNMVFWWCALPIGMKSENAACVNLFFLFFLCCRPWLEWSHIYAVCHWGWMRDAIQSSRILLILPEKHMEPTMLRHREFRFMQLACWEGFISLTPFASKKNSHQNSNCISQCRYHSQSPAQIAINLDSTCFSFAVNNHKSLLLQEAWWGSWHSKLRNLCCPCLESSWTLQSQIWQYARRDLDSYWIHVCPTWFMWINKDVRRGAVHLSLF